MEASRGIRPEPDPSATVSAPARDRHALLALAELASTLARSRDMHAAVDALLLNLMGHLGTARAAVCLIGPDSEAAPVPVRCHGLARPMMTVVMTVAWGELRERLESSGDALRLSTLAPQDLIAYSFAPLARQAGVELLVPLRSEEGLLGVLALGWRVAGRPYGPLDLELIEASAAMAGTALRNTELQGRAHDIGRRQRLALEELAELNQIKTELVANLNHELRTPLAVMMASLDCLAGHPASDEQIHTLVQYAQKGAQNLSRVVQQLLNFSDGARKQIVVNLVEQDLSTFLADFVGERRPGVSSGLRELQFDGPRGTLPASFDPTLLRQVLDELVDNAAKFTPPGSTIRVALLDHLEDGTGWRRIEVRDNGPGIAFEQQPRLFEEFRQADGSATRTVGGLGLGLSVARRLVEAMGGKIVMASGPGEGASFAIMLKPQSP